MKNRHPFTQTIIWALVAITFSMTVPLPSQAMLAPAAPEATAAGSDRVADLQSVQRVLENKIIQQRLEDLGLTIEEINAKVNGLSDSQLHQMASQINALMPGGDEGLGLGT